MFKYKPLDSEVVRKIDCPGCEKHVEVTCIATQQSCVMIEKYIQFAERIKNLTVYEDDVWVVSFPKCGTTWTQEMVWLLNNDLDYERAKSENILFRFPFLE